MRTFWKAYQVYFPMAYMSSTLDYSLMRSEYFSEDYSEGQQSVRRSTSHAKTVPLYNISWFMLHMVGKIITLAFQHNKPHIIWTSQ